MRGARQPLAEADDVFEPGFLGRDHEGDRSLNHVGLERRAKIGALHVMQCVSNTLDIAKVCDGDLGPLCLQLRAAAIFPVHQGADWIAAFSNSARTRPPLFPVAPLTMILGLGIIGSFFTRKKRRQTCPVLIALAFILKNSSNLCGSRPVTTRMASVGCVRCSPLRKYCQRRVR